MNISRQYNHKYIASINMPIIDNSTNDFLKWLPDQNWYPQPAALATTFSPPISEDHGRDWTADINLETVPSRVSAK